MVAVLVKKHGLPSGLSAKTKLRHLAIQKPPVAPDITPEEMGDSDTALILLDGVTLIIGRGYQVRYTTSERDRR